jgi:hypothetical protein
MDCNWALREVQLTFDEVDSPFVTYVKRLLRITGRQSAYRSTASRPVDGSF